jgi:hypothetical protein
MMSFPTGRVLVSNRAVYATVALFAALVVCQTTAHGATTYYWNSSTTGNWNDSSKWTPNTGYPQAGDTAIFSGSLNGNCVINVNVSVATINEQSGYTGNPANNPK